VVMVRAEVVDDQLVKGSFNAGVLANPGKAGLAHVAGCVEKYDYANQLQRRLEIPVFWAKWSRVQTMPFANAMQTLVNGTVMRQQIVLSRQRQQAEACHSNE
jgi:hypothetical protein